MKSITVNRRSALFFSVAFLVLLLAASLIRFGGGYVVTYEPRWDWAKLALVTSASVIGKAEARWDAFRKNYRTKSAGPQNAERYERLRDARPATFQIVLEIPVTASPPSPWDEVWKAVAEAREAFERGGSTGWNACVDRVRFALEKWQDIPNEKEYPGPGWVSPKPPDREARTKKQRLDNLRWHLMLCAHQGSHTSTDGWTRDDAILMLATLTGVPIAMEQNPTLHV